MNVTIKRSDSFCIRTGPLKDTFCSFRPSREDSRLNSVVALHCVVGEDKCSTERLIQEDGARKKQRGRERGIGVESTRE